MPAYWLKDNSLTSFNSLIALFVVFGVLTFILIALLNIYIPYCMRLAKGSEPTVPPASADTDSNTSDDEDESPTNKSKKYGFSMSIFGTLANGLSATLMLVIVIIIAATLPNSTGQAAGLIVTTVVGFITMAGAVVCYFGLPTLPTKPYPDSGGFKVIFLELLTPYREMLFRKRNMMFLLLAYTIYSDTLFALNSITSQLYYIEVKPDTLEYTLYSLAGNLYYLVLTLVFYLLQVRFKWNLEKCLLAGYALVLIVPVWGCIGLASDINFGFKVSHSENDNNSRVQHPFCRFRWQF